MASSQGGFARSRLGASHMPRHWSQDRVIDYMRCLFWNSPLWTPFESLKRVNQRKPLGIFIVSDRRPLLYGDATCLIAWYVRDLRIERNSSGKVVMQWTAPAGSGPGIETGTVVSVGTPIKRRYEWSE